MADLVAEVLAEFNTVEEIDGWRQEVAASILKRATETVTINAMQQDGHSHSAIELSSIAEKRAFLETLKAAKAIKLEESPEDNTSSSDFSQKPVEV